MPRIRRIRRPLPDVHEVQERPALGQRRIYSMGSFNARARSTDLRRSDTGHVEPDEELADSELSEAERQAAIARERMRREGLDV